MLRNHPPAREKFAQGQPHDRPAVPGLFQLIRQLRGHLIEGRNMFILELNRYIDQAMLVFFVLMAGMVMAAVRVMVVGMIVFVVHTPPRFFRKKPAS